MPVEVRKRGGPGILIPDPLVIITQRELHGKEAIITNNKPITTGDNAIATIGYEADIGNTPPRDKAPGYLKERKRNLYFGLRFAWLVSRLSLTHQEMVKAMAMELLNLERFEKGKMFLEGDCEGPLMLMLTDRETEILNYIAEGYPDRRIALEMAWSVPTVKRCVGLIVRKLNVANRTQAVVVALRQGLIEESNEKGGLHG